MPTDHSISNLDINYTTDTKECACLNAFRVLNYFMRFEPRIYFSNCHLILLIQLYLLLKLSRIIDNKSADESYATCP